MTTFVIRKYTPADEPQLRESAAAFQETQREFEPEIEKESREAGPIIVARMLQQLQNQGVILVAESEGKLVGFGAGVPDKDPERSVEIFYISDLYVREDMRGQGIGTALMQALQAQAESKGFNYVSLRVYKENAARDLYRRLGFREYNYAMLKKLH